MNISEWHIYLCIGTLIVVLFLAIFVACFSGRLKKLDLFKKQSECDHHHIWIKVYSGLVCGESYCPGCGKKFKDYQTSVDCTSPNCEYRSLMSIYDNIKKS